MAVLLDLQIMHELQKNLLLDGLEEVRLIKDKRTGMNQLFQLFLLILPLTCD